MKTQNRSIRMWSLLAVAMGLVACGGGGGPSPLGLFDGQQQNQNPGASRGEAAQILSVSDAAMGARFSQGSGGAGKGLTLSPSFGFETFLSKVGKAGDVDLSTNCELIDEMNAQCSAYSAGPLHGSLNASMSIHLSEATETRAAGTIDFIFRFDQYTFNNEAGCGEEVSADGLFGCQMDVAVELSGDGTTIDLRFSGLCNTAEDPDLLMDIVVAGKPHQVGYDLALDFQMEMDAGNTRDVQLNEANITGTVQVDGVNYPYEDLNNAVAGVCGQ